MVAGGGVVGVVVVVWVAVVGVTVESQSCDRLCHKLVVELSEVSPSSKWILNVFCQRATGLITCHRPNNVPLA